ncbi:MAG: respiratory nitrate reductase subunit gamma [Gammaproteobacteria bacterium]|nr:respiratory nitrate reductase subunit gamma [Gammaproteobacteria bacterium]
MFEQLVDGIFWNIALIVFFVGVTWRLITVLVLRSKRIDYSVARNSGVSGAIMANIRGFYPRKEVSGRIRLQVIAGYMFHLGFFVVLFFAAPHVKFIAQNITGFTYMTIPYWGFIVASEIAFAGLILLWLHRLLNPVTRLISKRSDHIATILVFVVMLTGCMALGEASSELRVLHRFSVELLMVYFPFSALMHAFMFIPSRAFTGVLLGRRGVNV